MDADISLGHQSGIAVATVFAIDYLKKANWFPWINNNTETLNRVISVLVALFTASGLKVLSGNAASGWTISIPAMPVLLDTLVHASAQFGGQEILQKLLGNHQLTKELSDKVTQLQAALVTIQKGAPNQ